MKRFAKEYVSSEEDAENIVHDVFLEIWEKRDALSFDINLVAFLFTSIKNKCIDHLRHKIIVEKAVQIIQEDQVVDLQMKINSLKAFEHDIFSDSNIESLLEEALNSLPQKCREIFIKSKIEGKKHKEIADELNISIKTIENQMTIAYKKLRLELKDYLSLLLFLSYL